MSRSVTNQLQGREKAKTASPIIKPLTILALVLIGVFSFAALFVLIGYGDDLRKKESGQATPISRSAVGYTGFVQFLEDLDLNVSLDSNDYKDSYKTRNNLRIYTPSSAFQTAALEALSDDAPKLIILPKWNVQPLEDEPGWVRRTRMDRLSRAVKLSQFLGAKGAGIYIGTVLEKDMPDRLRLQSQDGPALTPVEFGEFQYFRPSVPNVMPSANDDAEEDEVDTKDNKETETDKADKKAQDLADKLEALLSENDGEAVDYSVLVRTDDEKAVLIHLRDTRTYVVSDPDFFNNLGLSSQSRAKLALELLETVMVHGDLASQNLVFDLSIHGIGSKPNLIKLMTQPPFLAATLCLIGAAFLIAWQGFVRFGDPARITPDYSQGPASLAKSSAAFFDSAGRLGSMGQSYQDLIKRDVIHRLGLSGQSSEIIERRLAAREELRKITPTFKTLDNIQQSQTGVEFMTRVKALAKWKEEMLREH